MPDHSTSSIRVNAIVLHYLARFGAFAHIAPFSTETAQTYARGEGVICRTARGLELAEVLTAVDPEDADTVVGSILRKVTPQDELLLQRLAKNKDRAITACAERIAAENLNVTLMDAEHLFDGKSIYFYFLGEASEKLDEITRQLAEAYESEVQFRKFSEAVNTGCGPGCGTESAAGCSTSGCASCAITGGCGSKK